MARRRDRDWLAFLRLDHRKLAGKYVVLVGGVVVGAGANLERYVEKARREFPNDLPHVIKVPDPRRPHVFSPRLLS